MKTYSIGRDQGCDIVINDNTDVISRRHAILNVTSTGKMTIIDQSTNGTYVNGIRISSNVAVPVTRKDTVSLARVVKLDWNRVPAPDAIIRYSLLGIIAVAIIVGGIFGYIHFINQPTPEPVAVSQDSTKQQPKVEAKTETEQEMHDRIARALQDSLERVDKARKDSISKADMARQDSINAAKKKAEEVRKVNDNKKKDDEEKKKAAAAKARKDSIKASQSNMM